MTTNKATFKAMAEGTREDYQLIDAAEKRQEKNLPAAILAELEKLKEGDLGFNISRYDHSLQSATRAYRDGVDEELVVAALLHDIGDGLALHNHAEVAAAILRPYVSEKTYWIVKHHGIFQGYYFWHHLGGDRNARDKYRDHPWFDACAEFCEKYDQNAFDDDYENLPLEFFQPMVKRLFSRPPFGNHTSIS